MKYTWHLLQMLHTHRPTKVSLNFESRSFRLFGNGVEQILTLEHTSHRMSSILLLKLNPSTICLDFKSFKLRKLRCPKFPQFQVFVNVVQWREFMLTFYVNEQVHLLHDFKDHNCRTIPNDTFLRESVLFGSFFLSLSTFFWTFFEGQ